MNIITKSEKSHFYYPTGVPCHEVVGKNGKIRPTTIRDARELGLVGSVTSITKMWPKDGLQRWIMGQHVMAGITTPRLEGEGDAEFVARVIESAEEEASLAAEKGSRRHRYLQAICQGLPVEIPDEEDPFITPFKDWYYNNVNTDAPRKTEFVTVNPTLCYAGTVDLGCTLLSRREAIVDFKNRKNQDVYDTDAMQLAAYCASEGVEVGISVVLASDKPGPALVKEWSLDELAEGFKNFECCLTMWKRSKKYWPVMKKEACQTTPVS